MRRKERRKRRTSGHESRDRWMITYADLITLLLIFFVIMFAMSSLDTEKYKIVTGSLSDTFKAGGSILDGSNGILDAGQGKDNSGVNNGVKPTQTPESTSGAKPTSGSSIGNGAGSATSETDMGTPSAREQAFREQEAKLADLMGVITKYVKDNNLGDQIFVADKPQGIAITLSDRFLFDIGQADLKPISLPVLHQLGGLFNGIGATISIEGHTDNIPVSAGSRYNDNWELSGARALSVLRFFLDTEGLNPADFQYAGYADTRPTANNNTPAGRQKNRRVAITVLRQLQAEE
ncbi:OmpA family protein [Paenibacillus sp. 19GGS1-52]|uniref:flagellar motor protein MotB n=1 Tax=Paenibacillus sp. 19GGS1-52 TaxID=2758563 RepID=UPI001EFB34CF|nr:flagellar motor protein MotB [Paenibacillus sp. 19GGS1-52]ULO08019.1 OmpA family protein [Paenibacillus sp. 19GGS1-52]